MKKIIICILSALLVTGTVFPVYAADVSEQQMAEGEWVCPECGTTATGNFCSNCGTAKPQETGEWVCPECGATVTGNFCSNCGASKPGDEIVDAPAEDAVVESETYASGNFEYIILPDGNIRLTKCYGDDSRVTVSSEIDGHSVTEFADYLFKDKTGLEDILIWADISDFGTGTFSGCTKLTDISIPSETLEIKDSLFEGCTNLETVIIWGDIISIGERAFKDCSKLDSISIPSSTQLIGKSAFENCTNLESVIFWGGKVIGPFSFRNCSKLDSISIPSEVKEIGDGAFADCTKLDSVILWNKEANISSSAFYNCPKLEGFGAYAQEPPVEEDVQEAAEEDVQEEQEHKIIYSEPEQETVQENATEPAKEDKGSGLGDLLNNLVDSLGDAVSPDDGVTLENFNKIDSSMTYEDVCSLFGKEGELLSETDIGIPGYETQMYAWYDWTGVYNCTVIFQGGYETSKSQLGLK